MIDYGGSYTVVIGENEFTETFPTIARSIRKLQQRSRTVIEILDEMDPAEFARAVKKECIEIDGHWVIRLVYPDDEVKFVRNLAVPVEQEQ